MATLTFNSFSLSDDNFITERVFVRSYANRAIRKARVNRREGIKILGTEFTEKTVEVDGIVVADSATELQSLLDEMKKALTAQESSLVVGDRTYTATVESLGIPDEHYNQSKAPYSIVFTCSDPFSVTSFVSAAINVPSGVATVSGRVTISGTFFARPIVEFGPSGASSGDTLIKALLLYHVESGQTVTVSGFSSGASGGLNYNREVTIDLDAFTADETGTIVDSTGGYQKFEPGENNFTLTASGRNFPGGRVTLTYRPRYL